ncbi:unnamed protein product, partial [Cladocopium goreaui]
EPTERCSSALAAWGLVGVALSSLWTKTCAKPSLQKLRQMHPENGSSLPLDGQLRGAAESQVLSDLRLRSGYTDFALAKARAAAMAAMGRRRDGRRSDTATDRCYGVI